MAQEAHGVLANLKSYLDSLDGESDRGIALAVAAALEEVLGSLLRAHMAEDRETEALLDRDLSSFATRIATCHVLGLISDGERAALTLTREIRNAFAHQWAATRFDAPEIDARCRQLPATTRSTNASLRNHFTSAVSELLFLMIERGRQVKRVQPGWWNQLGGDGDPP